MSLRIGTNVVALTAQRNLGKTSEKMDHALKAIASGTRLVNASDDAAGLAISENLRGQVRGLRQAGMNAENAQSLIQVAEGGLNEQNNILIRMRELSVQSASDTVSDVEREFLNQEFVQLREEFERIAQTTTFGNKKLLTGTGGELEFHVGTNGGEENIIKYEMSEDATAGSIGIDGLEITSKGDSRDSLESIDEGLTKIASIRANFGAIQSRLNAAKSNIDIQIENVSAARSRIADSDLAYEAAELVRNQVLQNVGVSTLTQATQLPMNAARLIQSLG